MRFRRSQLFVKRTIAYVSLHQSSDAHSTVQVPRPHIVKTLFPGFFRAIILPNYVEWNSRDC